MNNTTSMPGSVSMEATLFVQRDGSGVSEARATVGIEVPAVREAPGPKTLSIDVNLEDGLTLADEISAVFFRNVFPALVRIGQSISINEHCFERFVIRFAVPGHAENLNCGHRNSPVVDESRVVASDSTTRGNIGGANDPR